MAHTFIPIKMALIPWQTKKYVTTFWSALFSNDGVKDEDGKYTTEPTYLLLDGRNDKGELVHPMSVLLSWTQWSVNPREVVQELLDDAIEYTSEEFNSIRNDINSTWYKDGGNY